MTRSTCVAMILVLAILVEPSYCQDGAPSGGAPTIQRGSGGNGGPGMGRGRGGRGPGAGGQHGHDDRHDEDQAVFQYLLQHHQQINRTITDLSNGVETLTESDVPEVADKIKEHVEWMEYRIKNTHPIRMRDPLFAELFRHTDKIEMTHEDTEKGVRVTETSNDPYVAQLIQAHAKTVSAFVQNGFAEAMKNHPVPSITKSNAGETSAAVIPEHGPVTKLPNAVQQPRPGTKIVVDLTGGSDADKLNKHLEKVAKYLNIYAGAGSEPADVNIAVVFHGDATLAVLNPDAYAAVFGITGNPNLALMHQLHQAGVELYVCGQSLISKGSNPDDVAVFVDVAVSAITSVANLQADGYAYVPLGK
jgi:uncharacterized protein